jgi:hypothetical protein
MLGMGDVTGGFLNGILMGSDRAASCQGGHDSDGSSSLDTAQSYRPIKCDHQKRLRGGATNEMTRRLTGSPFI